ncbi:MULTISPECIES: hypothetical protein [unclassified Bradyrhizobium]|uniref:hypothetical protein n=1 Tax=unclassified Bradyrhizobium TaxID=2631580 RepID=UPI002FF37D04
MFITFAWYFLSLEGRISRQEFRLGYFGLVIVNALLIRTWRNLTVPRVRYYSGTISAMTGRSCWCCSYSFGRSLLSP